MVNERILLRPAEVAAALGIGRSKTYALIAGGTIPSLRIGGSLRVPAEQLRTWVAQHVTDPIEGRRIE